MAYRTPKKWSKNKMLLCKYWLLQYPEWKREYYAPVSARTVQYDNDVSSGCGGGDPVALQAMRKSELRSRMDIVENTIAKYCQGFEKYMMSNLTEGVEYRYLEAQGMPICRNVFYERKRFALAAIYRQVFGESIEK